MIDLRSDTLTTPTLLMRQAMAEAEVGDDVYNEDPTVKRLEEQAAKIFGKEKGLFVPSGTMANQIAVLTHTNPGDEIIVEADAHVYYYELAGLARLGGVQARTIKGERGRMPVEAVRQAIRPVDLHFPKTSLICLENTHNRAGGTVLSVAATNELAGLAKEHKLALHLDGARIFNAAQSLGVSVQDLVEQVDSVMFCLSKGLAAPVGSILLGTEEFIGRARKWRKMLGGGMRQAGVIAACGLVALDTMVDRLAEDHQNAHELALGLADLPGIEIDLESVQTNIVVMEIHQTGMNAREFIEKLLANGVKATFFGDYQVRLVTHKDITRVDITEAINRIKATIKCLGVSE